MKVSTKPNQFAVTKITKGADETVSNSDVLQDDDELTLSLVANSDYLFDFLILFTSSAVADLKARLTFSQNDIRYCGSAFYRTTALAEGWSLLESSMAAGATAEFAAGGNGATIQSVSGSLRIHTVTALTITVQWAQNTAEVSNTIVKASSWIQALKV